MDRYQFVSIILKIQFPDSITRLKMGTSKIDMLLLSTFSISLSVGIFNRMPTEIVVTFSVVASHLCSIKT